MLIFYYVYIIAHLYGSESYDVNFRLFNAYKMYKVIKVKEEIPLSRPLLNELISKSILNTKST